MFKSMGSQGLWRQSLLHMSLALNTSSKATPEAFLISIALFIFCESSCRWTFSSLALRPCVISYCVPWKSPKEISLSLSLSLILSLSLSLSPSSSAVKLSFVPASVWTTKLYLVKWLFRHLRWKPWSPAPICLKTLWGGRTYVSPLWVFLL